MKKCSTQRKRIAIEVMTIICLLAIVIISLLADCAIFHIPNSFILNVKDVENLFFTLFTVQASVSTVSIAIVSIINGLVNEYVLGISISRYVMHQKPILLKHNRLIISNLIICVLNYFCLSYCWLNVCIALFVASIIITVLMIKEIYVIFMGKNIVRQEICNYVYENYDLAFLKDLNMELMSAIETGNSLVIQDDFKAIEEIFEREVEKSKHQKTEIIEQLSTIICDAFEKTSYKHNGQKNNQCLLMICAIYKIANKPQESPLHLDIWERTIEDFLRSLKDIHYEQLKDDFAYYILHGELYKNLIGRPQKEIEGSYLRYYSSWVYSILLSEDSHLKKSERLHETKSVYEMASNSLYYGSFFDKEFKIKDLMISELCNLHKIMIDKGDLLGIKKHYFDSVRFELEKYEHAMVYIVTLIYLYYLSAREPLAEGKELQENAKKIIEENHSNNEYFYYHLDLVEIAKTKLSFLRNILRNWECMNELEAKWIIMDYVIDDFFIFSVLGKFWQDNIISDMINILAPDSMFPLYDRYFSKDNGDSLRKSYSEFEMMFNKEKDENIISDKILLLNDIFNERYKAEIISEGELEKISDKQKENFEKAVKNKIKDVADTILAPFAFKSAEPHDNIIKKDNTIVYVNILSNYFFRQDGLEKHVEDDLFTQVVASFIKSISHSIVYKEVSYKNKHKQKNLIDAIEELSLNPSVTIGNRDDFWGDEEERDVLKKYTAGMKRIKYPGGYNYYFILDEGLIEFSIENIRVEFTDLTWENIKHKCKGGEDGNIKFNVTNDIYLPFTKSEIEKYITNTEKKVLVYADVKIRLGGEKTGAGIKIVSK